jgi:predicted Fe-Mo cluster-binding NifX family protein
MLVEVIGVRILFPTVRGGLDDQVAGMFARAPTFTLVDVDETGNVTNVQVVANPAAQSARGAGVTAAQFCIDSGVDTVVAPQFGPNASGVLQAAGIRIFSVPGPMTVKEAVEALLHGGLSPAVFGPEGGGMGGGYGRGMGRGGGMGRGMGRGRGAGGGMGRGRGW